MRIFKTVLYRIDYGNGEAGYGGGVDHAYGGYLLANPHLINNPYVKITRSN